MNRVAKRNLFFTDLAASPSVGACEVTRHPLQQTCEANWKPLSPGNYYEQLFGKHKVDQWLQPHIYCALLVAGFPATHSTALELKSNTHWLGFALTVRFFAFDLEAVFGEGFGLGTVGGSVRRDFPGLELTSRPSSAFLFLRYFFCSLQHCTLNSNLKFTSFFVTQKKID